MLKNFFKLRLKLCLAANGQKSKKLDPENIALQRTESVVVNPPLTLAYTGNHSNGVSIFFSSEPRRSAFYLWKDIKLHMMHFVVGCKVFIEIDNHDVIKPFLKYEI